ncbi:MAG TPA: hypothetical protein V6D22_13180 [Candidatus Obscuribacterales bacterium]
MQENADQKAGGQVQARRNAIGEVLQRLSDKGIDVEGIAENAGVPTADVNALSHDDLISLTAYISQNHPEVLKNVSERFPALQGLIGMLEGGELQGILGKFEQGNP